MANLTISGVEDIGNGQYRCTVTVPDESWGVPPGEHDNYVVGPGARHGIGAAVRALIAAGHFAGEIKPFVPEGAAEQEPAAPAPVAAPVSEPAVAEPEPDYSEVREAFHEEQIAQAKAAESGDHSAAIEGEVAAFAARTTKQKKIAEAEAKKKRDVWRGAPRPRW